MKYRWAQTLLGKAINNNVEQFMSIYTSSYLEGSGRGIHQVDVYGHSTDLCTLGRSLTGA